MRKSKPLTNLGLIRIHVQVIYIFKQNYVFPFLKKADLNDPRDLFTKRTNAISLLNKYHKRIAAMCGIDKNLPNHIARHSFGNIAGDAINSLMLQKLYRHSDLRTTINYQANFIHKDADEPLESVLIVDVDHILRTMRCAGAIQINGKNSIEIKKFFMSFPDPSILNDLYTFKT